MIQSVQSKIFLLEKSTKERSKLMKNWLDKKKIFLVLWKILETGLTVIQLYKMISESPVGEWIKRTLSFLM